MNYSTPSSIRSKKSCTGIITFLDLNHHDRSTAYDHQEINLTLFTIPEKMQPDPVTGGIFNKVKTIMKSASFLRGNIIAPLMVRGAKGTQYV